MKSKQSVKRQKYSMKPVFEERMRKLLPNVADFQEFEKIIHKRPRRFIRCNTLKINPAELVKRLSKKWKVEQPFAKQDYPEIIVVEGKLSNNSYSLDDSRVDSKIRQMHDNKSVKSDSYDNIRELEPGELGNSIEHLLGYYYVQEISSMLPIIALDVKPGEFILDLCSSPGSKTTQMASLMKNKGTIIANDIKIDRIKILNSNLERCGVSNVIVTRNDGVGLCQRLADKEFKFDKILLDAPCSGEGTLRSSPKTFTMWNLKVVKKLSREQKKLFANAVKCLKVGGEIVYSTCTHAPEENEAVVNFALKNFPLEIEQIKLPLQCREGVKEWEGEKFDARVKKVCRIYPQDNDSEGFFVSKFKLKEEVK